MRTRTYKETYSGMKRLLPFTDYWVWYGLLIAALTIVPQVAPTHIITYVTVLMIAAIGAIGLNIVTGTAGLISLGHAGFLAIGAYTFGILLTDYHWGILSSMGAAAAVSALSSLLVGVPSLRLKGLYLAITTLAFSIIVTQLIPEFDWLTGGSDGKAVGRPELLGMSMGSSAAVYYLVLVSAIAMTLAAVNLLRSRVGRAWAALRDYDTAASLMGVNLVRYKLMAFATSAAITGVAGALLGLHLRFLNVDNFALITSIEALTMIIVGGLGSVRGAILGAVLISVLPDASALLFEQLGGSLRSMAQSNATELKGIIYAVLILLFLRYEPDGISARWIRIKRFWQDWPFAKRSD